MEYKIIELPISSGNHSAYSKKELRAYHKWFMEVIPERIEQLVEMVKSTPGYEDWEADYTPKSLGRLTHWFRDKVEIREMSQDEIESFKNSIPEKYKDDVPIQTHTLHFRTLSLAYDVGMYVGEVMVKNNEELQWELILRGGKTYIDYGYVSISGFIKKITKNPIRMVIGLGYDVLNNKIDERTIEEIYYLWMKYLDEKNFSI